MKTLDALRQRVMTRAMKLASARAAVVDVSGLQIGVAPGVCNPAPAFGRSFAPLFEAALVGLRRGERVLDLGTGSGVWALLAVRAGGEVTATDLAHVSFDPLLESARRNRLTAPRCLHGDLFEPVRDERFDRIVFNPPFHFGEPARDADRAYLGGANGEVVRRFLSELDAHRAEGGRAYLILPRTERDGYEDDLARHAPEVIAEMFLPVLGHAQLLGL